MQEAPTPVPGVVEIIAFGGVVSELKAKPHTAPLGAISGAPAVGDARNWGTVSATPLAARLQSVPPPLSALVRLVVPKMPPPVP